MAYPGGDTGHRVAELEELGVTGVSFGGPVSLGGLDVLGKGYVGVVVLARMDRQTIALKIRRTDSQRDNMEGEAALLSVANKAGVGPRLVAYSRNFLAMEYLEGERIGDWVCSLGEDDADAAGACARKILEDCYRLDEAGLDHGELSFISKHVIVGCKTTIVDFESSSTDRRPANVTSAAQAIFMGGRIARMIGRVLGQPPREELIGALRGYKQERNRGGFESLLEVLRV
ncbi:Ser/Thr protein kinase [Cenarchaeum symbiosum A]|uniref:Ser/Thr protein kinase n=1 Tax=Cenarchaeum symbiosum (strain A) TaxID=414004 RepID=A0RYQ3_CENSY|nr:Ser/Thr protein kinase [Cenarchaeum symbiosum A]